MMSNVFMSESVFPDWLKLKYIYNAFKIYPITQHDGNKISFVHLYNAEILYKFITQN